MKALVLCGGIPQVELINQLKARNITAILADMNDNAPAVKLADKFYQVSTLDTEGIKQVAIKENVDFLISVCADQMILVVANVSEMLGLPCYISYETAQKVSNKELMKDTFVKNGVPTSKHIIISELDENKILGMNFPLIVKPVDSYSSRGVKKINDISEFSSAFDEAVMISRTNTAIVEEFVEGQELSVDVYVENGVAKILCVSSLDKVPSNGKFVIQRCVCPANISFKIMKMVEEAAQKIADAFNLTDTPMLIQLIVCDDKISIIEFCARTGGGNKFCLIKQMTGFDIIQAVLELTLGKKPHVDVKQARHYVVDEFLYCSKGVFDHLEGFDELVKEGIINEYFQLKHKGATLEGISSSGDRVAYFSIVDSDIEKLKKKHQIAESRIKAISVDGKDLLRHDLIKNFKI